MKKLFLFTIVLSFAFVSNAQIYQFRGPNRDGKFPETGLLKEWPDNGPELILEYEGIGDGWSSVITNGKYIYASGKVDKKDWLTCIDFDGNLQWKVEYGDSWNQSYPDTRGSATIEGDRLYIISGQGQMSCINANTGETIWYKDVDEEYQADYHTWGVSESPLIVDDKVICSPAGPVTNMVALDKMTGEEIWKTESTGGQRGYASPIIHEYNGKDYIVASNASDLYIVDPENGDIKSTYKFFDSSVWRWQPNGMIWANSPVVKGNMIFLSIGYDYVAKMVKVSDDLSSIEEVYSNTLLDNHHHGLIELDGYLYGSYWINNNAGAWGCIDWETGETMYDEEWNSKGEMVYADGMLYVYDEKRGNVGLVEPTPTGFNVVSSFVVEQGSGTHWAHPYLFDGKMFMRHGDVLMVYNIKQ